MSIPELSMSSRRASARLLVALIGVASLAVGAATPATAAASGAHRASPHRVGGDFDGDGFSDLAIGVPGEGPLEEEGAVQVLYGSAAGLKAARNQLWTQDSPGVPGTGDGGHLFGRSLAAGDFNGDG